MRNIFKTFKENKRLLEENAKLSEENKVLKVRNEALLEFKSKIDYYISMSNVIPLRSKCILDRDRLNYPTEYYKMQLAKEISKLIIPHIEFDIEDNNEFGTKNLIGTLSILKRWGYESKTFKRNITML